MLFKESRVSPAALRIFSSIALRIFGLSLDVGVGVLSC